jgi:hypothetical protein
MRFARAFRYLILVSLLLLCACAGGEPVSLSSFSLYPGATPAPSGSNFVADAVMSSIQQSLEDENFTSEVSLYQLPGDATWDAVQAFYAPQLDDDWKPVPELAQTAEGIDTAGWQRGGSANEQILILGRVADPLSGAAFLLIGLFSE